GPPGAGRGAGVRVLDVRPDRVALGNPPGAADEVARLVAAANRLDLLAVDGGPAAHDLEAVVGRRVVAAGDLDAAVEIEAERRVVEDGGRHHADVGDLGAGGDQALEERVVEARRRQPAVAAAGGAALALGGEMGADGAAEIPRVLVGEVAIGDPTEVVLAEDPRVHQTYSSSPARRATTSRTSWARSRGTTRTALPARTTTRPETPTSATSPASVATMLSRASTATMRPDATLPSASAARTSASALHEPTSLQPKSPARTSRPWVFSMTP